MDKVIVGGNVSGDITSCGIDSQLVDVAKDNVWSIRQMSTYRAYDMCTKQVINEYSVPEFTMIAPAYFIGVPLMLIILVGIVSDIVVSYERKMSKYD